MDDEPERPWSIDSVVLVRHGQSKANTNELSPMEYADHAIPLTDEGIRQATAAGVKLTDFLRPPGALIYRSPYFRARETLHHLLAGAGVPACEATAYEDPRLREVDHGYGTTEDYLRQQPLREKHGWFYYRFQGGESPADGYDRVSGFVDSMWRRAERKNGKRILIVSHGLTIRCFVMRFLHLTVEEFDHMANPDNTDMIELRCVPREQPTPEAVFRKGHWACFGLKMRPNEPLRAT